MTGPDNGLPQSARHGPRRLIHALLRSARAALSGGWSAVRDVEPEFWRNLQLELLAGRQWVDRAIVLAYAALTGALVVGFTLLTEGASHSFAAVTAMAAWTPYLALV